MKNKTKNIMGYIIFWIILILLLLYVVFSIANSQDVQITDMSGGLRTNADLIKLQPNEFSIGLNGNINRGIWERRKGSLQLLPIGDWPAGDTLAGNAPNSGIFAFRRADGVRRICGITSQPGDTTDFFYWTSDTPYDDSSNCPNGNGDECDSITRNDSTGLGWFLASPGLPAIPPGSGAMYYLQESNSRVLYKHVYTGVTPHWTYWNDMCYVTFDGRQRMLAFHPYNEFGRDGYARELVPLTPGEPLIVPMNVEGNPNGLYYYMIGHTSGCGEAFGANEAGNSDFEIWESDTLDLWDTLSYTTGQFNNEGTIIKNGNSSIQLVSTGDWRNPKIIGFRQAITLNSDSSYIAEIWINKPTNQGTFQLAIFKNVSSGLLSEVSISAATDGYIKLQTSFSPPSGDNVIDVQIRSMGLCEDCDTVYIDLLTVKQSRNKSFAVVTKPVIANKEKVFLTNFSWQAIADNCAWGDAGFNALNLDIYRTKANPGNIDNQDNFYLVTTIALTDTSQIDTLTYIDNTSDASLSALLSINIDTMEIGRDVSLVLSGVRVGAPTYVSNDSLGNGTNIFKTFTIANETFLKTSYIITYYDSLINAESDSSRSLHIFKAANENMYHIGLPPSPGGKSHLTRRLWKSYQSLTTRQKDSVIRILDTTIIVDWSQRKYQLQRGSAGFETVATFSRAIGKIEAFINDWGSAVSIDPLYTKFQAEISEQMISYRLKIRETAPYTHPDSIIIDTVNSIYRLIAEIKNSDSVFVDSIEYDSTIRRKPYFKSAAPFNLKNITSFGGALWGTVGDILYWSYLDTGSVWGSFRNIILKGVNGDVNTAVVPMRDYVRVFQNYSQFLVYPGAEYEYERREFIKGLGCIASHTAIAYQGGVFYLSHQGLIYEAGSEYRDRGSKFGIISESINNILLNRTKDALRKAYGIVHNDKYWLSFSDVDTTFVYHLKTGGWTIYNYALKQATMYDTLTANSKSITPSGDMVFIDGKTDQLYKADTLSKDKVAIDGSGVSSGGTRFISHYRSAPFGVSVTDVKVSEFGIWRQSDDDTTGLNIRFYDMESDSVEYKYVDMIAKRYDIHGVHTDVSNYFQIDIRDSLVDSLAIPRIDIWLDKIGLKPKE